MGEIWPDGELINPSGGLRLKRLSSSIPSSYTVFKIGSIYYAEANFSTGTNYSGTDTATVIQATVDALTNGGKIFIKRGTYPSLPNLIVENDGLTIQGEGDKTILNFASGKGFLIRGSTVGNYLALSSDASMYDDDITLDSVSGLAIGDYIRIEITDYGSPRGEMNVITNIVANTLTLKYPLRREYLTAKTAQVKKVNPIKDVFLTDFCVTGGETLVRVTHGVNVACNNVTVMDTNYSTFWYEWAMFSGVYNCSVYNSGHHFVCFLDGVTDSIIQGNRFNKCADEAIHLTGCFDCVADSNVMSVVGNNGVYVSAGGLRNVVSSNHLYKVAGAGLYVQSTGGTMKADYNVFVGNTIVDAYQAGIMSSNGVAENIYIGNIIHNTVGSGISLAGDREIVALNQVDTPAPAGIRLDNSNDTLISENFVKGSASYGIYVAVDNNRIRLLNNSLFDKPITIHADSADTVIMDNYVPQGISDSGSGTVIKRNTGYVTENNGTSTGTGAEQTIPHGLAGTPTMVILWPATATPTESSPADATNIYVTADNTEAWSWKAEYWP